MLQEISNGQRFRKLVTAVCMCVKFVFVCGGEEERVFPRHWLRIRCVYLRTKPSHRTWCLVSHVSLCLSGCEGKPPKVSTVTRIRFSGATLCFSDCEAKRPTSGVGVFICVSLHFSNVKPSHPQNIARLGVFFRQ